MAGKLTRWQPFAGLDLFRREMDDMFQRFFGREPGAALTTETFYPPVEISETKEDILVKAELPGMKSENIDISVTGDVLTIKGEKKYEKKGEEQGVVHQERAFGSFYRQLHLPCEVNQARSEANFKNGMLEIHFAKAEPSQVQKIQIKVK